MPLRPLRFRQHFRVVRRDGRDRLEVVGVVYGEGFYRTDCGRFLLVRRRDGWQLLGASKRDYRWISWCEGTGMSHDRFPTRREALATLEAALRLEGLLESDHPPRR